MVFLKAISQSLQDGMIEAFFPGVIDNDHYAHDCFSPLYCTRLI
jgi:hypothetical protein